MAFPVVGGLRAIEFGTPGAMRQRLVDLVINGNKRAAAGQLAEVVQLYFDRVADDLRT